MKKTVIGICVFIFVLLIGASFLLKGLTITNPVIEQCAVSTVFVAEIEASSSKDIFFKTRSGKSYYINRGTERGLSVEQLQKQILNKEVEIYLAKVITGVSNHISQLSLNDKILFTEFNQ